MTLVALSALLLGISSHPAPASGIEGWEWRNPLPHGSGLWQLVECDGRLIATGRAGTIQTTEDGVTWTQRVSGTRQHLLSAAAAGQTVVALGAEGAIVTSTDRGQTWTVVATESRVWSKVIHAAGKWMAAGYSTLATSSDGLNWTTPELPEPGLWYHDPLWTGTRFIVRGFTYGSPKSGIFYSDDAAVWLRSELALDEFSHALSIVWTGSRVVASIGNELLASTDGVGWTAVTPEEMPYVHTLVWTGNQVLALSHEDPVCFTSPTGENWTPQNFRSLNPYLNITTATAHGNQVLAGGRSGDLLLSADNGATWQFLPSGLEGAIHAISRFAGRWVVVGSDGNVASSPDGVQWVPNSSGTLTDFHCVAWHDGLWVAGGQVFARPDAGVVQLGLFTSADGRTWTNRSFTTAGNTYYNAPVHTVIHTGERWMAVATGALLTSVDAVTWEAQRFFEHPTAAAAWNGSRLITVDVRPSEGRALVRYSDDLGKTWSILPEFVSFSSSAIIWSGTQFMVLGGGRLHSSDSGNPGSWKMQDLPANTNFRSIYADSDGIVLGGSQWGGVTEAYAAVLSSRDGSTWTPGNVPSGPPITIHHVSRAGSLYVAVGQDGDVLTSGDAVHWTRRQAPTTHELHVSGWNGQELLVLGEAGTILAHRSPTAIVPWSGIARESGIDAPLRLTWPAVAGRTYLVESSTDLAPPWNRLPGFQRTAITPTESIEFRDSELPASKERFFRLLQRP